MVTRQPIKWHLNRYKSCMKLQNPPKKMFKCWLTSGPGLRSIELLCAWLWLSPSKTIMNNSRWYLVRKTWKSRRLVQSCLISTERTSSCNLTFQRFHHRQRKKTSRWSKGCPRDLSLASLIWAVQIEPIKCQRLWTTERLPLVRGLNNPRRVSVPLLCPPRDLQKDIEVTLCHHKQQAEVDVMLQNGPFLELRLQKGPGNQPLPQLMQLRLLKTNCHCRLSTRL